MKYALISDVHSNLPALEAVLEDVDAREDVDAIYHLGDLVGYAPWPDEVVVLVKERGIAGNYALQVVAVCQVGGLRRRASLARRRSAVPQEARLRCRLQEPSGGFAGTLAQRRLTKRSREVVNDEVGWGAPCRAPGRTIGLPNEPTC